MDHGILEGMRVELSCPLCDCVLHTLEGPGITTSQCPTCGLPGWKKDLVASHKLANLVECLKALLKHAALPLEPEPIKPQHPSSADNIISVQDSPAELAQSAAAARKRKSGRRSELPKQQTPVEKPGDSCQAQNKLVSDFQQPTGSRLRLSRPSTRSKAAQNEQAARQGQNAATASNECSGRKKRGESRNEAAEAEADAQQPLSGSKRVRWNLEEAAAPATDAAVEIRLLPMPGKEQPNEAGAEPEAAGNNAIADEDWFPIVADTQQPDDDGEQADDDAELDPKEVPNTYPMDSQDAAIEQPKQAAARTARSLSLPKRSRVEQRTAAPHSSSEKPAKSLTRDAAAAPAQSNNHVAKENAQGPNSSGAAPMDKVQASKPQVVPDKRNACKGWCQKRKPASRRGSKRLAALVANADLAEAKKQGKQNNEAAQQQDKLPEAIFAEQQGKHKKAAAAQEQVKKTKGVSDWATLFIQEAAAPVMDSKMPDKAPADKQPGSPAAAAGAASEEAKCKDSGPDNQGKTLLSTPSGGTIASGSDAAFPHNAAAAKLEAPRPPKDDGTVSVSERLDAFSSLTFQKLIAYNAKTGPAAGITHSLGGPLVADATVQQPPPIADLEAAQELEATGSLAAAPEGLHAGAGMGVFLPDSIGSSPDKPAGDINVLGDLENVSVPETPVADCRPHHHRRNSVHTAEKLPGIDEDQGRMGAPPFTAAHSKAAQAGMPLGDDGMQQDGASLQDNAWEEQVDRERPLSPAGILRLGESMADEIRQNVPQTSKDWEALEQQAAMLQKMEAQAAAHCHARGIKLPTQCSQAAGPCLVIMDSQGGAAEKPPGAKAGDTNLATMQMSALDIGTERSLSDIDAAMTARGYRLLTLEVA